jgi:gamma-glutamyltranspeptidase/glutathione hydrolase
MLRMLEGFDLATIEEPGLREHLLVESMKLAFADRAFWLGDPAFTPVPRGLVDEAYCARLAAAIDPASGRSQA